jgi:hypothetical protein
LTVAIKATYELSATSNQLELAPKERQRLIRQIDEPWGKPETTSVKYPGDVALSKPGTDVVVVSKAYPPPGEAVKRFDAFVKVGPLSAGLVIYGLRVWDTNGAGLSSPLKAQPVELRYENAWGGRDDSVKGVYVEEPRNPLGCGVAADPKQLTGKLAPCIEYAEFPIKNAKTRPPPAGVGAIARYWEPRRSYAGTYDKAWKENRAPLIPEDEEDQFHCFASRGLHAERPLLGVEEVGLLNLLPDGKVARFYLPSVAVEVDFHVKNREREMKRPHLDTVIIDTLGVEAGLPITVELLWHTSIKAPRRVLESNTIVRKVRVS